MDKKKLMENLFDAPLDNRKHDFFVNREEQLKILKNTVEYNKSGLFGVCGETGVGKTSVLNMIFPEGAKKVMLALSEKDSKELIIGDILYKLSIELSKFEDKKVEKSAKEAQEWLLSEITFSKGYELGGNAVIHGNVNSQSSKSERLNVYSLNRKLDLLLEQSLNSFGKILLVIDELDKEQKEDTMKILDSIKRTFLKDNLIVVLTLPFSIYREYKKDRMKWNESGNLENILKDVVFLEEFDDFQIKEILLKRMRDFIDFIEPEILDMIVLFADGNPRDALWISQKIILENISRDGITSEMATGTISKTIKEYMSDISFTDLQRQSIYLLKNKFGSKEDIIITLTEGGIKRTTAYSITDKFIENGILIKRMNSYRLSGKIYFQFE